MKIFLLLALFCFTLCDLDWTTDVLERARIKADLRDAWVGPELENPRILARGVRWYELVGADGDRAAPDRIWVALPPGEAPVGCVLIPPVSMGATPGGRLEDVDREQLRVYARLGVAAVGFDVPGAWAANASLEDLGQEIDRYLLAAGGIRTGRMVLDFIGKKIQRIDVGKVWAVGEGLGATLALQLAARDGRVRAVIGLDPVTDLAGFAASEWTAFLTHPRPALKHFLAEHSPRESLAALNCPVLLQHDAGSGRAHESLGRFYLDCLRHQKTVTLIDIIDVDLPDTARQVRTARAVEWLGNLNP